MAILKIVRTVVIVALMGAVIVSGSVSGGWKGKAEANHLLMHRKYSYFCKDRDGVSIPAKLR